jgi:hypothetical protein
MQKMRFFDKKNPKLSLPEHLSSHSVFSVVRIDRYFVFCVMFRRSFILFSYLFWPLYCMSFYLRLILTPLISTIYGYYLLPQKTKYRSIRTTLKTECELRCSGRVGSSCLSCYKLVDKSWMMKWPDCS